MNMGKLMSFILNLLVPPSCFICEHVISAESELCDECISAFRREMFEKCEVCSVTADRCNCISNSDFGKVARTRINGQISLSLTFYISANERSDERITERMIFLLKRKGVLTDFFATQLSGAIERFYSRAGEDIKEWILTYPPRSARKKSETGFDQSELIVRRMSEILGIPWAETMMRLDGDEQKTLTMSERRVNADNTLVLKRENIVPGGKYIVIDDVMTTGSTMSAAVRNLSFGGAKEIFPVTIAKTMYNKPKH